MQRGFIVGTALGATVALGIGLALAVLPTTPTYALWELTLALDRGDVSELTRMVDVPAVTLRAMSDLQSDSGRREQDVDFGRLARAFLAGDKIGTIFDDPEQPLEVTPSDFLAAWWSMRRDEGRATLTLQAGDRQLDLILEQRNNLEWKVVGVSPIGSLLRIEEVRDTASDRPTGRPPALRAREGTQWSRTNDLVERAVFASNVAIFTSVGHGPATTTAPGTERLAPPTYFGISSQ